MKVLIMAAALLLTASLPAQTAQVIQLSSADAKEAKQIADQQAALDAHRAQFEEKIKQSYVHESGWESGFQYSTDYRFIVPAPSPRLALGTGCIWGTPVGTLTGTTAAYY